MNVLTNSRSLFVGAATGLLVRCFCLLSAIATPMLAVGQEASADIYQEAWEELLQPLGRREYGAVITKLDALAEDSAFRAYGQLIEADKTALGGLMKLEQLVLDQASELKADAPLEVSGLDYTVTRYQRSSKGDALVLVSSITGKETTKLVSELPTATWVHLAEPKLESLGNTQLTLGIFLGFDRVPDLKTSRKLLSKAAESDPSAAVWLTRLDQLEAGKGKTVAAASKREDPIVGNWSIGIGPKPKPYPVNVEFRKDGTATMLVTPQMLVDARGNKGLIATFSSTKWVWDRKSNGTYRITIKGLGMTFDNYTVKGDRLYDEVGFERGKRQASQR